MQKPSGSTSLCIIADDLTGACDAGAAFARRGALTEVLIEPTLIQPGVSQPAAHSGRASVVALCTATRDIAPSAAAQAVEALAHTLDPDRISELFKKIDSVFRGNTLVEIAAILCAFPQRLAVIAPAFPALGRTCADGMLHLSDAAGRHSIPLRGLFDSAGVHPHWLAPTLDARSLASGMKAAVEGGAHAVFCEATSDEELHAVERAARMLEQPILWIGSAGLAHALADSLYPSSLPHRPPAVPEGTLLAFTGSNHPLSARQLAHLREEHLVLEWPSTTASRLDAPVVLFRIERGQTTDAQIREAVCSLTDESSSGEAVGCLLMNGGDTALQVCRALGIRSIHLRAEFAPGIPVGTACGGQFDGATILLKSGGFGEIALLSRIAHQCSPRKEMIA